MSNATPLPFNAQNCITVAKSGGEFTTVQDALDSITDAATNNWYSILLCPGIYEENVIGKNFVGIFGLGAGSEDDITIQSSSGVTFTAPTLESSINNVVLRSNPTADGGIIHQATQGGTHNIFQCFMEVTSTTNGVTGKVLEADCDSILFARTNFNYTMLGSAAGVKTHKVIDIQGSTEFVADTAANTILVADVDDDVEIISINSTGTFVVANMFTTAVMLNPSYTGNFKNIAISKNSGFKFPTQNFFNLIGSGSGTAFGVFVDTDTNDGFVQSAYNKYSIVGFTNNFHVSAGTGDVVETEADLVDASDFTTGAGVVDFINSQADGGLTLESGTEFTIDSADEWHAASQIAVGTSDEMILKAGATGSITALADEGGGQITATATAHGLDDDDFITITGTSNNDGVFQVTNTTTNTFEFTDTFVATDTGTFHRGTSIKAIKRGRYRIDWGFSITPVGNNVEFEFCAYLQGACITGSSLPNTFGASNDTRVVSAPSTTFMEKDDIIWFAFKNLDNASNITLNSGSFNSNKIS